MIVRKIRTSPINSVDNSLLVVYCCCAIAVRVRLVYTAVAVTTKPLFSTKNNFYHLPPTRSSGCAGCRWVQYFFK